MLGDDVYARLDAEVRPGDDSRGELSDESAVTRF